MTNDGTALAARPFRLELGPSRPRSMVQGFDGEALHASRCGGVKVRRERGSAILAQQHHSTKLNRKGKAN